MAVDAAGTGSFHGNSFSGIEGIYGGDAIDRFTFAEKGSISGEIAVVWVLIRLTTV